MAPRLHAGSGGNHINRTRKVALPDRYDDWIANFQYRASTFLTPNMSILDVGGGRSPIIPVDQRPLACKYVGLDLSVSELRRAPAASYDEVSEGDVTLFRPDLVGRFDLIVSYNVFEHVRPLDNAFANLYLYCRPGSIVLAQFAATFSYFALASRLIPETLKLTALRRFTQRSPETVFPAHYNHCWASSLGRLLGGWTKIRD